MINQEDNKMVFNFLNDNFIVCCEDEYLKYKNGIRIYSDYLLNITSDIFGLTDVSANNIIKNHIKNKCGDFDTDFFFKFTEDESKIWNGVYDMFNGLIQRQR